MPSLVTNRLAAWAVGRFVCISVLLNLAEDIHTERKMVKRKIVVFLAKVRLGCHNFKSSTSGSRTVIVIWWNRCWTACRLSS
jgi:hypothetical protein